MKAKTTLMGLGLVAMVMGGAAHAERPRYAKIEGGVGNCIFSKQVLAKDGEDSYHLEAKFRAGDEVHLRCYYDRLGDRANDGKRQNTLRAPFGDGAAFDGPHYRATLYWKNDPNWWFSSRIGYDAAEMEDRVTSRLDIPLGTADRSECDWNMSKFEQADKCVDLATETRNLRDNQGKSGAFTATICVELTYEKVDKLRMVNFTEVDDVETVPFARGCFSYTVD